MSKVSDFPTTLAEVEIMFEEDEEETPKTGQRGVC